MEISFFNIISTQTNAFFPHLGTFHNNEVEMAVRERLQMQEP
jgi:hypothetical protein